jgi:hypothetical protein
MWERTEKDESLQGKGHGISVQVYKTNTLLLILFS